MKIPTIARCAGLLSIAYAPSAFAGFFGTFNPVPEPSVLSLVAIGGGLAAGATYLSRIQRNRKSGKNKDDSKKSGS